MNSTWEMESDCVILMDSHDLIRCRFDPLTWTWYVLVYDYHTMTLNGVRRFPYNL